MTRKTEDPAFTTNRRARHDSSDRAGERRPRDLPAIRPRDGMSWQPGSTGTSERTHASFTKSPGCLDIPTDGTSPRR